MKYNYSVKTSYRGLKFFSMCGTFIIYIDFTQLAGNCSPETYRDPWVSKFLETEQKNSFAPHSLISVNRNMSGG